MKAWVLTLGAGAVLGAVGVLMMPRENPTRKLATQAAEKAGDAAERIGCRICRTMDL